ncbi:MAG: hypothetical protein M1840_008701 [Geoglossum simile]|nr:MAG: hypothetical protein M1840_008701 [Geoglossum simile]
MLPGKGPSKPNNPTNKPSPSSTKSSSATSSTSSSSTTSSTTHPHYTATQTQDINYTLKKQAHAPFVSFGIIEPTAFSGGYLVFPADPSSATTAPAHSTTPTGSVSLTTSSATTRGSTSPATTTKSSAAQTTSSTTTTKSSTSSKTSSTVTIIPTRPADPIDKPTCQANVVNSAPPKLMINGAKADLDGLLFMLREVICSDKCVVPAGLDASVVRTTSSSGNGPDCEIAVALPYSIEAYATRNSHSQGDQWQECWDSTQNIINTCIKNGPNAGWWSGKYENQFYQLGVRPLNGQGNKHTDKPLDPSKHLTQAPSTGIGPVIPPPPPPPPPTPSQTGCNNHGSGLCPEVKSFGACVIAFGRYSDDYIYKSFTSYTVTIVGQLVDPGNFLGFGYPGCAAMFGCDNAQAYAVGMSGKQIKNAISMTIAASMRVGVLIFRTTAMSLSMRVAIAETRSHPMLPYIKGIARWNVSPSPIVRINPYELHISDPDYYDEMYTGPSKRRDKWAWSAKMFGNTQSMLGTVSHDHRRIRRSAINPYFSKQSVARLGPVIQSLVDTLCDRFEGFRETGGVLNLGHAYAALMTDVITEYCFARSYGFLGKEDFGSEWPRVLMQASEMSLLMKQFGWLYPVMDGLPDWVVQWANPPLTYLINLKRDVAKQIQTITRRENNVYKTASHPTIFHEILESDSLPPEEKTIRRLAEEGQTAVGAGILTTAHVLRTTSFHLLANAEILQKLKSELASSTPSSGGPIPLRQLEQLPYLTSVVNEGFRMAYGVGSRLARVSPDVPLIFQDWVIPPGTPVSMTAILLHENPTVFPKPGVFRPERWLDTAFSKKRLDRYLVPFSKGTRVCAGMNLAYAGVYITLATVFGRFEMELFETDRGDVDIVHDFSIHRPSWTRRV